MKKLFLLSIILLSMIVMGFACSSSSTQVSRTPLPADENDNVNDAPMPKEPEFLEGEIADDQQPNVPTVGEVEPTEEILNTNSDVNVEHPENISVRVFNLIARRFEFSPDIIKVKKGNKVIINITSEDVEHGFNIDEYKINKTIPAGGNVTVEFIADVVGKFDFYCNVYCGVGHSNMRGQLIVE